MARSNALAQLFDHAKWGRRATVSPDPAEDLYIKRAPSVSGTSVAQVYGYLVHYTTWRHVRDILARGYLGGPHGCWLTPSPLAACMVPYDLGLDSPRDACLLVDPEQIGELWGPGTVHPKGLHKSIWRGGGVEFYSPHPLPLHIVKEIHLLEPCGDLCP